MTTTQTAAPTIRNAGTKPATAHKLFVNIAVNDLQRSIDFFEALGFRFNPQFTDATATCMLVGEDAYFMLITREKFRDFSKRPVGDPHNETTALFAISVNSRNEVDETLKTVLAAGGTRTAEPEDHGFMYSAGFYDLDGHHWDVFWMDPTTIQG
jgi:predicted lactoylglutathione lyase